MYWSSGFLASGGVRVLNYDVLDWPGISDETIHEVARLESWWFK
jgi:hypothetical protein